MIWSQAAATLLLLPLLLLATTSIADTDDNQVDQYRRGYNASAHWELINEKFFAQRAWVRRYRSQKTNLTVTVAENKSPTVAGLFCLVTEDPTDDGLPHTLEHLIFQGSKHWPYKEVLDVLAKKSLAGITNAWTAQDHTCYWVNNAGSDGFLNTLPVYLDHMFHPTLEEAAFVTEVHHIDGKGEDAGTVYSEMQAADESHWRQLYNKVEELLYPGDSSYESNTGGSVVNLRNSTTLEKIKKYHDKFYRPHNVEVIITGPIDINDIFESLADVEDNLIEAGKVGTTDDWEVPFSKNYSMPEKNKEEIVLVPGEHDERGKVVLAWRLPFKYRDNLERMQALSIMNNYLFSTSVAPFKKAFVDAPKPLASGAWLGVTANVDPYVEMGFSGVEVERMGQLEPLLNKTLENFYKEDMDLDRIKTSLMRKKERMYSNMESSSDFIQGPAIRNLIHGGDWEQYFSDDTAYDKFLNKDQDYWKNVIRESLKEKKIMVKLRPCPAKSQLDEFMEKKRINERKEKLGEDGLKKLKKELEDAVANRTKPPAEVIKDFPLADASKISFWPIESYNRTMETQPSEVFNIQDVPFKFHFDHLDTMFIRLSVMFDIRAIKDPKERILLGLLNRVWLESPIKYNDSYTMEASEVIKTRQADTISFYASQSSSVFTFYTKMTMDKYRKGIEYNRLTMFNVEPSVKLLKSKLEASIGDYASSKRDPYTLMGAMQGDMLADDEYPLKFNFMQKHKYYKEIKEKLEDDPDSVIEQMHYLRRMVLTPKNAFVYLAGHKERLADEYGADVTDLLRDIFPEEENFAYPTEDELNTRMTLDKSYMYRKPEPEIRQAVASINGTETCHLRQLIDLPNPEFHFSDTDPDLSLALEYINHELFTKVRGEGLAYGAYVGFGSMGTLQFSLYRASNVLGSYKVFREIVGNLTMEFCNANYSEAILESCFGSRVFDAVDSESSLDGLSSQSKWSVLVNSPGGAMFNRNLIKRLTKVTVWDVSKAIKKYFTDFLFPEKSFLLATCGNNNAKKVVKSMKEDWKFEDIILVDDIEKSFVAKKDEEGVEEEEDSSNST